MESCSKPLTKMVGLVENLNRSMKIEISHLSRSQRTNRPDLASHSRRDSGGKGLEGVMTSQRPVMVGGPQRAG